MNGQMPNNSGVGMDPTTLGTIGAPIENLETLDTAPTQFTQEKREDIGQVPPEQKDNKKKPMNKILFILLIVALIAGVAYGVYYYLSLGNKNDNRVKTKDVSLVIGETLPTDVREYATFTEINPTNCLLDTTLVNVTKTGTYDYSITCGSKIYKGKVLVKEGELPEVVLKDATIEVNGEIKPEDFIESCDDDDCTYAFVKENEVLELLKKAGGPYEVEIKITAKSGSSVVKKGNLTITEFAIIAYLECTSPSGNIEGYKGTKTIVDRLAIGKGNVFVNLATRNYVYTFTDEVEYNQLKTEKEEATEFDKITGNLEFNDTEKNLKITVKLVGDTLDLEYGGEFPKEYIKINAYYTGKDYTCRATK